MLFARQQLFYVAGSAQLVKLFFDQLIHFRIRLVTVKAHTDTCGIDVVVMAYDARLLDMVCMGKPDS